MKNHCRSILFVVNISICLNLFGQAKEDSINSRFSNIKDTSFAFVKKLDLDTLKGGKVLDSSLIISNKLDSNYKGNFINNLSGIKNKTTENFKLSGTIRNSTLYSTEKLNGQEMPTFTNRTFFDFNVSAFGLPLQFGYTHSTEDNALNKQIGAFRLQLDKSQIENFLKEKSKRKILDQIGGQKIDSISNTLKESIAKISKNIESTSNKDYQKEIEKSRQIIEDSKNDSVYSKRKKSKVELAQKKIDTYNNQIKNIDSLEKVRKNLTQKLAYLKALRENGYDVSGYLNDSSRQQISPYGKKYSDGFNKILNGIENFELGDIYLSYSNLFMNGFMLRGIKADFQFDRFYIGYSGGITNNIGNSNPINSFSNEAKVQAANFGIGNQNDNSLGLIFLTSNKTANFATNNLNIPERSNVIGLKFKVNLLGYGFVEIERAVSNTYRKNPEIKLDELSKTFKSANLNSGTFIKLHGDISETKSKYLLAYTRNDLYFFSIANPMQRSDCQRLEFRLNQAIIGSKLQAILGYRNDKDNLSETKQYTTTSKNYELGLRLKGKRTNTMAQYRRTMISNSSTQNLMLDLTTLNINYTRNDKIKGKRLLSNINYCFLFFDGQLDTLMNNTHIFNLVSNFHNGNKLGLSGGGNLNLPSSLKREYTQYEVFGGVSYLFSKSFSGEAKYIYREFQNIEQRNCLQLGINYNYKKITLNSFVENQYVGQKVLIPKKYFMLIMRFDLVFRF